jgi:tRNA A-37 threonylcarbamoyl transferase component Bud32
VDRGYELYCFVDPLFYDSPARIERADLDFGVTHASPPEGWIRSELDDWVLIWPDAVTLPGQGWKIHASGCMENADQILQVIWDFCLDRDLPFKFVRGRHHLLLRNAKYADRGSSGKLAAIYPRTEAELPEVLESLGELLDGYDGPYILSDLRWNAGPLFVRYGGFAERFCITESGEPALAIADPDGHLVPDRRGPTFEIPPWVELPEFLEPQLSARKSGTVADLAYEFERAIHFSNGGGLYEARDRRTGARVVLKEARPHAGLSMDGADAVTRLGWERAALERLSGLGVVPALLDYFTLEGHHFLVEEFVDGRPLSALIAEGYPLALENPGEERLADYTKWIVDVLEKAEDAVKAVHERGMVIGDLHPSNMLIDSDGHLTLIDFEIATAVDEAGHQTLADPGFMTPGGLTGFDLDLYALACLRLFAFLPLTQLLVLDESKADGLADAIAELFPVPRSFVSEAADRIGSAVRRARPGQEPVPRIEIDADRSNWPAIRTSLCDAILGSATPERDDRLFPGDISQFVSGGLNLAYGAAGVLYALAATGCQPRLELEEWLVQRAMHPGPGTRMGFYDGLHGVAWALDYLGRRADALKVLSICEQEIGGRWATLGTDLLSGLSGIGLNLLHFYAVTGDLSFRQSAYRIADIVADRLGDEASVSETSGGEHPYAGLLRGSSGPALFFIRLYEQTSDPRLLDTAATAIRQDLRRCLLRDDGSLEVNEGWRTMPYVADGSVGIGMVLDEYLAHRKDNQLEESLAAISRAARGQFYIEPGLFYGRAGMITYLSRGHTAGSACSDPTVAAHIRRLDWHAINHHGNVAFPGEQLLRLSMDLGSGSAGVLLALGAAMHDEPVHLPFLSSGRTKTGSTSHRSWRGGE